MTEIHLDEKELELLAHLHETVEGYDHHFKVDPKGVMAALSVDEKQLRKSASYLEAFGLVGTTKIDVTTFQSAEFLFAGIYLTGLGEDFMRALEKKPGVPKKITLGVMKELWTVGKGAISSVAGQTLAEFVKHFHL